MNASTGKPLTTDEHESAVGRDRLIPPSRISCPKMAGSAIPPYIEQMSIRVNG
jgi:hypothetical protein